MLPHYRRNHQVSSSDGGAAGRGVGWLPPYATIFILVVGVAGGLIIIIAIILFCKCCIQMEKDIRRKLYSIKRQKHCLGHYVSLDCTSSKECDEESSSRRFRRHSGSSIDSSTVEQSLAEDTNLDLENEIDLVVAKYKEGIQAETILDEYDNSEVPNPGSRGHGVVVLQTTPVAYGTSPVGGTSGQNSEEADREEDSSNSTPIDGSSSNEKHVSFLLTEKSSSFGGYGGRGISKPHRCTEGDYHQLKHVKIDRSSAFVRIVRQPSLGNLGLDRPTLFSSVSEGGGGDHSATVTIESIKNFQAIDQSLVPAKEKKSILGGKYYPIGGHRTEVVADVHPGPRNDLASTAESQRSVLSSETKQTLVVPVKVEEQTRGGRRQSMSLEIPQAPERASPRETRRVRSYEEYNNKTGTRDYDRNKITQFIRKPLFNNDLIDEKEGSSAQSKVRYNDTGSFEEVDEEKAELLDKTFSSSADEKRFPDKTLRFQGSGGELEKEATGKEGECRVSSGNYQEIWNLRATFEEEEEMAAIIRIEDTSPEDLQSPSEANRGPTMTGGGANRTQGFDEDDARNGRQAGQFLGTRGFPAFGRTSESHLLFPDPESRRQTYRNVIARRMCRIDSSSVVGGGAGLSSSAVPPGHTSSMAAGPIIVATAATNSFDSAETMETDGEISDTSRHDLTTTSFESTTTTTTTTENTDSTGDGQAHKVSGMRGDSGYKSLETQHSLGLSSSAKTSSASTSLAPGSSSPGETQVLAVHPSPSFSLAKIPEATVTDTTGQAERRTPKTPHRTPLTGVRSSATAPFDRRSTKTASKKRRDYRAERHLAYDSLSEPGAAVYSNAVYSNADHSGDSFEECPSSSASTRRLSVLPRFLRYHIRATTCARAHRMARDYSVDEKTDALYHEFLRYDPALDRKSSFRSFSGFHRWQRVHCSSNGSGCQQQHQQPLTDQSLDVGCKRHHLRLTTNLRSSTYASEGKGGSFRRLSPQDSIEEELAGVVVEGPSAGSQGMAMTESSVGPRQSMKGKGLGPGSSSSSAVTMGASSSFDVPVIRLPDDDIQT